MNKRFYYFYIMVSALLGIGASQERGKQFVPPFSPNVVAQGVNTNILGVAQNLDQVFGGSFQVHSDGQAVEINTTAPSDSGPISIGNFENGGRVLIFANRTITPINPGGGIPLNSDAGIIVMGAKITAVGGLSDPTNNYHGGVAVMSANGDLFNESPNPAAGGVLILEATGKGAGSAGGTMIVDVGSPAGAGGSVLINVVGVDMAPSNGNTVIGNPSSTTSIDGTNLTMPNLPGPSGVPVNMLWDTVTNQVTQSVSSERYKTDIRSMDDAASEQIYQLEPKIFSYKSDPSKQDNFGLIAEELLAKGIFLNALRYDREGRVDAIYYETIFVALLNEFIKFKKEYNDLVIEHARLNQVVESLVVAGS